jgi:adenylate cyclase
MRRVTGPWSHLLGLFDPRYVYIGLAVALALWAAMSTLFERQHHLKTSTYDWMLNHRLRDPVPDPDIVLIDIDERSLATMASDYGRWPWPRDVLATLLAGLEAQGAKAVVFDILFSDADRQNPVSERAFDDAVAASRIAYFPVLRLNPANDAKSAVHTADLKGLVVATPASAPKGTIARDASPTLAVVLPYFDSAMRSGRLGTHNVDPDPDTIVRRYRAWEDIGGYRVLSLPARLALDFGWPAPDAGVKKLRFNARPMAYHTLSFVDVFTDLMRKDHTLPSAAFHDKIVIVGATAPGLFDLKGTPISRIDPGMDILATAIDNAKNGSFFRELPAPAEIGISIALLIAMPWLSIRYGHEKLRFAFVVAPTVLVAISYISINVSNTFIDLTAPASIAFLYFSLANFYSAQIRRRWAGDDWFAPQFDAANKHSLGCLAVTLPVDERVAGFEARFLNLLRTAAPHARMTAGLGAQSGWLGKAFTDIVVMTWIESSDDAAAIARAREEASHLVAAMQSLRKDAAPLQHQFLVETLPADHPSSSAATAASVSANAPPAGTLGAVRRHAVRTLISRTLMMMTEQVKA